MVVRRPGFPHNWIEYPRTTPEQLAERLADGTTIVITNKVPLREPTLAQAPTLKLIAVAATGTDVVDVGYCREHGITVSNIRGYAINTVPEHTFALIFALRRNLLAYHEAVRRGRWQESGQFCFFDYPIKDLRGSTLGIIGEGVLGQGVADDRPGARHAHHVRRPQGPQRPRAALHAVGRGAGDERHHHPAFAADAGDPQHDRHAGVPGDEAAAAADQHRARRPGQRGGPGDGACARA